MNHVVSLACCKHSQYLPRVLHFFHCCNMKHWINVAKNYRCFVHQPITIKTYFYKTEESMLQYLYTAQESLHLFLSVLAIHMEMDYLSSIGLHWTNIPLENGYHDKQLFKRDTMKLCPVKFYGCMQEFWHSCHKYTHYVWVVLLQSLLHSKWIVRHCWKELSSEARNIEVRAKRVLLPPSFDKQQKFLSSHSTENTSQ